MDNVFHTFLWKRQQITIILDILEMLLYWVKNWNTSIVLTTCLHQGFTFHSCYVYTLTPRPGFELSHCDDPGVPQFGFKVSDEGHFAGSAITFGCDQGYTLHGSGTLKCMTGERRAWNSSLPSCIGKILCCSSGLLQVTALPAVFGWCRAGKIHLCPTLWYSSQLRRVLRA